MPQYLIERNIPGAGNMTPEELKEISQTSNQVLDEMGGDVVWQQSYVTGDRITCVYEAPTEDRVREHAQRGGFPADTVTEIGSVIDPSTGRG